MMQDASKVWYQGKVDNLGAEKFQFEDQTFEFEYSISALEDQNTDFQGQKIIFKVMDPSL